MSYYDKLQKTGPRKLLACDGGGIRGIISIEILAKIENDQMKIVVESLRRRGVDEKLIAEAQNFALVDDVASRCSYCDR